MYSNYAQTTTPSKQTTNWEIFAFAEALPKATSIGINWRYFLKFRPSKVFAFAWGKYLISRRNVVRRMFASPTRNSTHSSKAKQWRETKKKNVASAVNTWHALVRKDLSLS